MDLGLKGKRAIVTGGTRGIGRAIVEGLLAEGAQVALCARKADEVETAIADLRKGGHEVHGAVVDVADTEKLQGWIKETAGRMGGLDLLVPNVSAGGGMDPTMWKTNFDVDLMGTVRAIEAAGDALIANKGAVVMIGTTAAVETFLAPQPYGAIKAAMITYGKQLAEMWAGQGVRVNIVSPGPVYFKGGAWDYIETNMNDLYKSIFAQCPSGRMADPGDVARAVLFLGSPAAVHITGVNLVVDGGFTKRVQF